MTSYTQLTPIIRPRNLLQCPRHHPNQQPPNLLTIPMRAHLPDIRPTIVKQSREINHTPALPVRVLDRVAAPVRRVSWAPAIKRGVDGAIEVRASHIADRDFVLAEPDLDGGVVEVVEGGVVALGGVGSYDYGIISRPNGCDIKGIDNYRLPDTS